MLETRWPNLHTLIANVGQLPVPTLWTRWQILPTVEIWMQFESVWISMHAWRSNIVDATFYTPVWLNDAGSLRGLWVVLFWYQIRLYAGRLWALRVWNNDASSHFVSCMQVLSTLCLNEPATLIVFRWCGATRWHVRRLLPFPVDNISNCTLVCSTERRHVNCLGVLSMMTSLYPSLR